MASSEESFLFSLRRLPDAEHDLDLQIAAKSDAIDRLIRKAEIGGIPILGHILNLTKDPEDLDRLGRALQKAGPLCAEKEKLLARKTLFELVAKEPSWVKWAFGDLSADVDDIIAHVQDDGPPTEEESAT